MQTDEKIRKTVELSQETAVEIIKIAVERKWSFSKTASFLIESAIKERNRKKQINNG